MPLFNIIFNYFNLSIKLNFWQNILLFFFCLLLIFFIIYFKIYYNTLKIKYLIITLFTGSFYILFYFGLTIYFRINNDTPINLNDLNKRWLDFYTNWLTFSIANKFYIFFIFIIIICIWILIFIEIRKLTKIEFYNIHLFLTFYMNKKKIVKFTSYGTFWFSLKLSGFTFKDFQRYCHLLNYNLYRKTNNKFFYAQITNIIEKIKFLPLFLLFIFFYYDYKYNNGQLYLLYTYMPIYFILSLYIQISYYFAAEKIPIMRIFFERYYCCPYIIYVNLTLKEEEIFRNWINYSYVYRKKNEPLYILDNTQIHPIQMFHRFILKHKKNIPLPIKSSNKYNLFYYNEYTNVYFYYKYLKNIDGKYFFKDKKKYTYDYGPWTYHMLEKNQPKK